MKSYKVDGYKFVVLPIIIMLVIIINVFLLFKDTYMYINILNIGIDIVLLFVYFRLFIYDINIDNKEINLKRLFSKKKVLISEIKSLRQGGILSLLRTERGRFFLITSKKDREVIRELFKDL
ncbi:hypothetical protein [Clostridium cylindrosporum]|uniref:Uncharacterized protein n=1 Tax=Clostridium cylindrosporum DSM 605 TaxID=1121307 RepID=A0A0J8D9R6_CLOCY|nr:hypothetical protein [Clostridium cylindrosporum]KMT22800.1 hypothetical protein CLCY_5c00390 [Clostridium cylindrosporum DSM 605]